MPLITSVEVITDGGGGLRIIAATGEVIQATNTDLPGNIRNGTAQEKEDFINNWLITKLPNTNYDYNARIHVVTATPLVVQIIVVDNDVVIPPNWWVSPL